MSLEYEPGSEPLHISVKQLFLNWQVASWDTDADHTPMARGRST